MMKLTKWWNWWNDEIINDEWWMTNFIKMIALGIIFNYIWRHNIHLFQSNSGVSTTFNLVFLEIREFNMSKMIKGCLEMNISDVQIWI